MARGSRWGTTGCALALAAAIASGGAAVTQADFVRAPGSPYATGNDPYSVNPGAFTADGLTDLAVVNGTSSNVHVYNQVAGNGGFGLAAGSPFTVGSGPNFAAVADFNADGRQDLAVANFVGESISVKLRQANDTFADEGSPIATPDRVGAIATGDFNGDGRADIVAAGWDNGNVGVLLRKADNTGFTAAALLTSSGTNPRYLAVADFDGTNGPDVAVTNTGTDSVSVLLNQGGGTLATEAGSPIAVGDQPQFVVAAPLDGDSRPDLAVTNYASDTVSVLSRKAAGGFEAMVGSPFAVGASPVGLAVADFEQTGRNDLVSANSGDDSLTILRNTGSSFTRLPDISTAPDNAPSGIATGQFNDGDARPDIAFTTVNTDNLNVFINHTPPAATTGEASAVSATAATLNAMVDPRGEDTDAYFEYGTSTLYGNRAPAGGDIPVGSGSGGQPVSRGIDGLAPGTTYHFRVVASSRGGSSAGEDRSFATPAAVPGDTPEEGSPLPPSSMGSGPPQAYLRAPEEITAGTPTTLSAEGSTPARALIRFQLDLDGSGRYATDLKTARSLETTFTTPGDVKVGLRVTDDQGRTDTVRRTVKVTPPPQYGLTFSPSDPSVGDKVRFTIRQLLDDPTSRGKTLVRPLDSGSLATMTFGDDRETRQVARGVLVRGRAADADGDFTHVYRSAGRFTVHANVDDGNGYQRGVSVQIAIGKDAVTYQPAISTATQTVEQGSCVAFSNATAHQLSDKDLGAITTRDVNPVNRIIMVKPDLKTFTFGGDLTFRQELVNPTAFKTSTFTAGSPFGHLEFSDLDLNNLGFGGRAKTRQAEPTLTTSGAAACEQQNRIESAVANAQKPYPAGGEKGWRPVSECPGGHKLTSYSTEQTLLPDLVTQQLQTTRHTWFAVNRWDFGDGTKSGREGYLPSYQMFHPYDRPGNFTVKLTTTFPRKLSGQIAQWNAACANRPLNALGDDDRFATRSTEIKLRVRGRYDRIKSRGLWMTSGAKTFSETDYPGVYESSGPVYLNTRRVGYGWVDDNTRYDDSKDVSQADGVLVITPLAGPLRIVPDRGEIIGAAHLAWQSGGEQVALGGMPLTLGGTPGMVIPPAGPGGVHAFEPVFDPPMALGAGAPPAKGQPFHVNWARVALREGGGGRLELNLRLPGPLGPEGRPSDQTITQDVRAGGRGLLDDVDVDLPAVTLVPQVLSFNGGKLSHHVKETPPWKATGSLTLFGKKIDMSPESKVAGCPVVGGLGFFEDGGLANAGAVVQGLNIPIPSYPAPVLGITDPAFQIQPATSSTPLDLFGCLTLQDYPSGNTFQIVGCVGLLSGGGGTSIDPAAPLPFCPDQTGSEKFALTEHNSTPDPARAGRRILRGIVLRASGTLKLGPSRFPVSNSYLEYRDSPQAIEARGRVGGKFLDDHLEVSGEIFGYIRAVDDWAIGGEGGVKQDLICVPLTDLCPSASMALLVSPRGLGGCVTVHSIGIGATVLFEDGSLHGHFPGCDLEDLKRDLGVSIRRLPGYQDQLGRPVAVMGQSEPGGVTFDPGAPYGLVVVNGTDRSPLVEVRDPRGRLVLDDTGEPVQGLGADDPAPQGILHNDRSSYQDETVDLRNATLVMVRNPLPGRYTISAKEGSAPITAISHSSARPAVALSGRVTGAGARRTLRVTGRLPAGSSVTVAEEGEDLNRRLVSIPAAKRDGRVARRVRFRPADGRGGPRSIVAVVSRAGIPTERIVLARYQAPPAPRAGKVRGLRARRSGDRVVVSWKRARHATRYVVVAKLRRGLTERRVVGARGRRVVLRSPLTRRGATVTVRAIGPLTVAGPAAQRRIPATRLKRVRHFVL